MRILVVEDDFYASDLLQTMLRIDGHEVVLACDGEEAWEIFANTPFSTVISDWMMPGLDGLELCQRIRARDSLRYCYVILITARTGMSNYLEAMNAGVDDFISKPYDQNQLRARLLVADRIVQVQDRIKRIEGILPTCAYCKKIRDEASRWVDIEEYISQKTEASFSHGVCPDCYEAVVKPEIDGLRG